jgi:hypothetical protein
LPNAYLQPGDEFQFAYFGHGPLLEFADGDVNATILAEWLSGFPHSVTVAVILDSCHSCGFAYQLARAGVKDKDGNSLDGHHLCIVWASSGADNYLVASWNLWWNKWRNNNFLEDLIDGIGRELRKRGGIAFPRDIIPGINNGKAGCIYGSIRPCRAWAPIPWDGELSADRQPTLTWSRGDWAADVNGHEVYFGSSFAEVNDADTNDTTGVYRGRDDVNSQVELNFWVEVDPCDPNYIRYIYDPGILVLGKTYYWRIDEVNDFHPDSPWKGDVWSFMVGNYLVVDGFEDYNNTSNKIQDTWIKGGGGTVGYPDPNYAEVTIVQSGRQSMPFDYNNTKSPYYSDATRTFATPQDWTAYGVKALELWFMGKVDNNNVAPVYVTLQDSTGPSATVIHPDPNIVLQDAWQAWDIALSDFTGVDMTKIMKITIGVGDSTPRGTGTLYFDDIRLYPPRCFPKYGPAGDITGDCKVDIDDLAVLSDNWLLTSTNPNIDLYYDGEINFRDFAVLGNYWLQQQLWPSW